MCYSLRAARHLRRNRTPHPGGGGVACPGHRATPPGDMNQIRGCLATHVNITGAEQERAAIHEAGHVLVAAARGVRVISVELHGVNGEGLAGVGDTASDLDQAWIAYGGPIAERVIYGNYEPRATHPGQDDLLLAREASRRANLENPDVMRQVDRFLQEHREGLELVAGQLLDNTSLQGNELDTLLHEALST
jgi:hypothetical protein